VEIVQDTNVFVSALRSQDGASAAVLDRCLALIDQAYLGTSLYLEYEELISRDSVWEGVPVSREERSKGSVQSIDAFFSRVSELPYLSCSEVQMPTRTSAFRSRTFLCERLAPQAMWWKRRGGLLSRRSLNFTLTICILLDTLLANGYSQNRGVLKMARWPN
jgi:hypothetical protein